MNRVQFDSLVAKLEAKFARDGNRLKRSSLGWAMMGYVTLAVYVVFCLSLVAGCIWLIVERPGAASIKLGIFLGLGSGVLSISIIRSLWTSLTAPEGREISRQEAPYLFEMIDSISQAAGGVVFHKVLLTDELNASVVQVARAGIFGFYKNYLSLGLPLLDALSPEEFKSVLAHEFSHLSGADGKVGNWIYRIRQTWERVADEIFSQGSWLNAPLRGFFGWFWPHFHARAFLLSRANEYRADAFAAEVTSSGDCAKALQRIHIEARNLDEGFWGSMQGRLKKDPEPPKDLYLEMLSYLRQPLPKDKETKWLAQAFASKTNNSDTHPALRDRCAALGISVVSHDLPIVGRTASQTFLGEGFASVVRSDFSKRWFDFTVEGWKAQREEIEANRIKLRELEENGINDEEGRWERITLLGQIEGPDAIMEDVRAFVAEHPDHHLAAYVLGSHLLTEDDAEGLIHLERASVIPELALDCMGEMAAFHDRHGDHAMLDGLVHKADEHDAQMLKTDRIRNNVSKKDNLVPHGLPDKRIQAIREAVSGQKEIRKAWLVRRQHEAFGNTRHFVLVLEIKYPWYKFTSTSANMKVIEAVLQKVDTDDALIVIDTEAEHKAIRKKAAKVPESQIYMRRK